MDENGEDEFEDESNRRHGMNMLGKASGELTEIRFNAFAKILNQKALGRRMWPFAAGLAGGELLPAGGLGIHVFQGVIGVGVVGVKQAAVGQIHGHRAQASDVGVDVKPDRHAVASGDDLHFEAVEPLPLAGQTVPVGLAYEQLAARDVEPKCLTRIF